MIVGLTGGICCGKSTATKVFRSHNIPVIDADDLAREVVIPGTEGWFQIVSAFGLEYLHEDDSLNREKLGARIFANKDDLKIMNEIMAPRIAKAAETKIKFYQQIYNIVVYDAALICENNNANKYKPLIVVFCPKEMQLQRLMKRNSLTEEQALHRINAQMSSEEKIKFADYVVDTSTTLEESAAQTETIIKKLYLL